MYEDHTLVSQVLEGDAEAFTLIVRRHETPVYNLALRMLGNPAEAEDASQEAFLRAYSKLRRYDKTYSFRTWLLSITSNHCIDRLRKRRIKWLSLDEPLSTEDSLKMASSSAGPELVYENSQRERMVQDLLDTLTPEYRAVVILHYWYGMPYDEIARSLHTTVSAIKSRLYRARRMMAEAAKEETVNHVEMVGGV
ncbi:MAG: sigma-70 family RNA polymerase sigma factor [Chloroflexota bacterium]